jgi:hypothetical protein
MSVTESLNYIQDLLNDPMKRQRLEMSLEEHNFGNVLNRAIIHFDKLFNPIEQIHDDFSDELARQLNQLDNDEIKELIKRLGNP